MILSFRHSPKSHWQAELHLRELPVAQSWLRFTGIIQHSWNFSKCHSIFVLCMCANMHVPVSVFQINNCSLSSNLLSLSLSKCSAPSWCQVIAPPGLCDHFPQNTDQNSWRVWPAGEPLAASFYAISDFPPQIGSFMFLSPSSCWISFSGRRQPLISLAAGTAALLPRLWDSQNQFGKDTF